MYFKYSFNIFHFYIFSFSLLYLAQIFEKCFVQIGQTSKTELFGKIFNDLKLLTVFAKTISKYSATPLLDNSAFIYRSNFFIDV